MSDTIQMIYNEVMRLIKNSSHRKSILNQKKEEIEFIYREFNKSNYKPKSYGVKFDFEPGILEPKKRSFVIDDGTIFIPSSISSSLRITGFRNPAATPESLSSSTIPFGDVGGGAGTGRGGYFDFVWGISDSGSDREWQNTKQPSIFMMSGLINPLYFDCLDGLSEGVEVFIDLEPILSNIGPFPVPTEFSGGVTRYTVDIFFDGKEREI